MGFGIANIGHGGYVELKSMAVTKYNTREQDWQSISALI